jgi:nucleoid-associated protein YgaU
MASTDLSSSCKHPVHTPVSLRKPLRCGLTILVCSCLFCGAARCRAQETQDAAEAARQERARKEQPKQPKHVYTEDDLGRARILTPEDEARFAASRKEQIGPAGEQAPIPLDASADIPQLPLGDIARRYRDAKRAVQAPTPFHLPFAEPAFASPIVPVAEPAAPRTSFSPAHPNLQPGQPKVAVAPAISSPAPLHRVDPFARRSAPAAPSAARIAPAAPIVVAPEIAPLTGAGGIPSSLHTITVQPGDSLWKLAQKNLGRGSRWQELLAANPGIVDPMRLAPGTQIVVPTETPTLKHVKSDTKIAVQKGDTLTKIAQSQYGRAGAWTCIAQANPQILDANRIYEGQQLLLPFKCKP